MYLSGNFINAKHFSDTHIEGPMIMQPWINYVGCPVCGVVFKKNEHVEKSLLEEVLNDKEGFKTATDETKPGLPLYKMAKILYENREPDNDGSQFLLWYLWAFNHLLKDDEKKDEEGVGDYKKYTSALLSCIEKQLARPEANLLKVEVLRERGDFDAANRALECVENKFPQRFQAVIKEQRLRIANKNRDVFAVDNLQNII
ncbi:MAG: hypothetical protein COY11_01745 [Candidatus Portnoybacteria bacterium CG_4_10_14_0_2_um_filter_44_20]|uniref:Uncharacterized protein n=1 Tax=Candidatus Portnoybacteria bacterium CG_4_10_14_0_2_um_filter_44_20 TaxID=1974799 RepID=A0A2M7UIN9_9BACT|nr:MAG: hypothetical protein COY11_01745 [Candidatus Portnoybacteria bacterium CG_4_10_14_0_2_um_filter_44_20]